MKKLLALYFLVTLISGCKRNVEPAELDAATIVAGDYKLTKAVYDTRDITNSFKETYVYLTVKRITTNTVKADFKLTEASPWSETWTLSKVTNDTIKVTGEYPFTKQYENGKIAWSNPAGMTHFWFEKIK